VQLQYRVQWPVSIVLSRHALATCSKMFSFFLRVKRVNLELAELWQLFVTTKRVVVSKRKKADVAKRSREREAAELEGACLPAEAGQEEGQTADTTLDQQQLLADQLRYLQLSRAKMLHVLDIINGYLITQVLNVSWAEFQVQLGKVENLADLKKSHDNYVSRAMQRCFLTSRTTELMALFSRIFHLILKFKVQVFKCDLACPISADVFAQLQTIVNNFNGQTHFLYDILVKLADRQNMQDLVNRLDFNGFFFQEHARRKAQSSCPSLVVTNRPEGQPSLHP